MRKPVIVRSREESKEVERLKKRKLELEVRQLELQVWEKEHLLGIKHSKLTETLELEENVQLLVDTQILVDNNCDEM